MLVKSQSRPERRGIVLVLVLAMLGLLALVGVTFATFSGQSRINNRNYQQSLLQPQAEALLDFSLQQLISDTNDVRSAIRGHSLARDMYGQGSTSNGYLPLDPTTGLPFYITEIVVNPALANSYILTTNIASNDPNFFGFNFTRWIMRVGYSGTLGGGPNGTTYLAPVSQTLEIIGDSNFNQSSNTPRTFTVYITPTDAGVSTCNGGTFGTLINRTLGTTTGANAEPAISQLPGYYLIAAIANNTNTNMGKVFPFQLDGRWLNAFNGSGMSSSFSTITIDGTNISVPQSTYGNFRYNGLNPNAVGMDEDYDACDLENWFLAIQSADGQVMIPSFHRPGVVRYDPGNAIVALQANDWGFTNSGTNFRLQQGFDSWGRILRPVAADGHDATTFRDLIPNPTTGQITYDVFNDNDGVSDSVWLDLGYPARPDASGRLYKPLFAFMVIGLNGRIPLNTAGNLATNTEFFQCSGRMPPVIGFIGGVATSDGVGYTHAQHLGNTVSEIDMTYALQNGFQSTVPNTINGNSYFDPVAAFSPADGVTIPLTTGLATTFANNTQVDNGGIDVRLTQSRNLLTGTRPQNNPAAVDPLTNGDTNYVYSTAAKASPATNLRPPLYFMPNGIADLTPSNPAWVNPFPDIVLTDPNNHVYVTRNTPPVAGRWGEAQTIPGAGIPNPAYTMGNGKPQFVNVVTSSYTNPARAGYSLDIYDVVNGVPRDAADDNFNSFDPSPIGHTGEVGDTDMYDAVGANLLAVDRMRRWLTPADINGTGRVHQWQVTFGGPDRGGDPFGRVEHQSYFRPPGSPGVINDTTTTAAPQPGSSLDGTIAYGNWAAGLATPWTLGSQYEPDMTNNPLHGFEAFRFPNQTYTANPNAYTAANMVNPSNNTSATAFTPQTNGGVPVDMFVDSNNMPMEYPTYDFQVNTSVHSDGVNEADEMNLYTPNPLLDSPFGAGDLEWLYRQQDVDGSSLTSRLSSLAPISFTNALDGLRRRRLFALDSWDTNNFVWSNDNPASGTFPNGAFPTNSRFNATASAGFSSLNVPASTNPNINPVIIPKPI